jgi:magnesium transporter
VFAPAIPGTEDLRMEELMGSGATAAMEACLVAERNGFTWYHVEDVRGPALDELAKRFGLHELAIEDCRNLRQRAKVEEFDRHLFVIANNVHFTSEKEECFFGEIDFFAGKDFVISVHDGPSRSYRAVRPKFDADPKMAHPGNVLEEFLDWLVDQYLPVLDRIEDRIEAIEERVVDQPSPAILSEIFALRRALIEFRRVATSMREVLHQLMTRPEPWLKSRQAYFRNIYDHVIRALDFVETYRDNLNGVLDVHLTATANRTNEIMRVLTVFATLATPFLMITGFFGMNFERLPWLHDALGAVWATAIMLIMSGAMLWYFYRKGWL